MPCESYPPSQNEIDVEKTATILFWTLKSLGRKNPKWIDKLDHDQESLNRLTRELCETIRGMTKAQKKSIIWNAHSKESRALADWWDQHQEADRQRLRDINNAKRYARIRARALKKLTLEERKALEP